MLQPQELTLAALACGILWGFKDLRVGLLIGCHLWGRLGKPCHFDGPRGVFLWLVFGTKTASLKN